MRKKSMWRVWETGSYRKPSTSTTAPPFKARFEEKREETAVGLFIAAMLDHLTLSMCI